MRYFLVVICLISGLFSVAQSELVVMSYNVLNFPNGDIPNRADTLKLIVDYVQPDLLLLQELKTEDGLQTILDDSFSALPHDYAASTFVSQQSNAGTSWPLQQAIIYNEDKIGLKSESYILTPVRDINEFKLYLEDPLLEKGADTTYFYVYVTHLKSSQGSENEALREQMAEDWRAHISGLEDDALVLLGGDFNLYGSDEDAYQLLLGEDQEIVMEDPIDSPGEWTESSFPDKEILTQSTRSSQIFGDGAGGGMDDRFDFILLSESLMNPDASLHYQDNSYLALGNNGTCYNLNITDCDSGNEVPDHILSALYYMSDHLPIVLNLDTEVVLTLESDNQQSWTCPSICHDQLSISGLGIEPVECRLWDLSGRLIERWNTTGPRTTISTSHLTEGIYILQAGNRSQKVLKINS